MYETDDDYTAVEMKVFTDWFDKEIGTDYEVNESASGKTDEFYTVFFEMNNTEVDKLKCFENTYRAKHRDE